MPSVSTPRLKVIVVGAGLGGLACGAALRDIADVTILESVREIREIGAAVHLAPNAYRLIKQWGGDLIEGYGSVECLGYHEWTADGVIKVDASFDPAKEFGTEWVLCHRVDVQDVLKKLATEENGRSPPAKLLLQTKISDVDPEAGTVTSADGRVFTADVIVGADGIRSVLRAAVVGPELQPSPSHHSAYRMLVPAEKIRAHDDLMKLRVLEGAITMVDGADRRIITYPCRNKTMLNFVCCLPDAELNEISELTWTAKGDVQALVKSFSSFAPIWQKLLSQGEEVGLWQLRDQDSLPAWVKGRLIIVGDAAHAMLPHQGQGASQALEDAEALGAFLKGVSRDDVHAALERVYKVRYVRATETQRISRFIGLGPKSIAAGKAQGTKGIDAMQFRDFNWKYYGAERWEKEHPEHVLP